MTTVVHITVPRDVLRALLDGTQKNFTFVENGGPCSPLRVTIYAGQETPPQRWIGVPSHGI